MQINVHEEPDCKGINGCNYQEPHRHGHICDKTCTECKGYCHPRCPAQKELFR